MFMRNRFRYCDVKGCFSSNRICTIHTLGYTPRLASAIQLTSPKYRLRICSKHFENSCYNLQMGFLKGSFPTLLLPSNGEISNLGTASTKVQCFDPGAVDGSNGGHDKDMNDQGEDINRLCDIREQNGHSDNFEEFQENVPPMKQVVLDHSYSNPRVGAYDGKQLVVGNVKKKTALRQENCSTFDSRRNAISLENETCNSSTVAVKSGMQGDVRTTPLRFFEVRAPLVNKAATKMEARAPLVNKPATKMEASAPLVNKAATKMEAPAPLVNKAATKMEASAPVVNKIATKKETSAPLVSNASTLMELKAPLISNAVTLMKVRTPMGSNEVTWMKVRAPLGSSAATKMEARPSLESNASAKMEVSSPLVSNAANKMDVSTPLVSNAASKMDVSSPLVSNAATQMDVSTRILIYKMEAKHKNLFNRHQRLQQALKKSKAETRKLRREIEKLKEAERKRIENASPLVKLLDKGQEVFTKLKKREERKGVKMKKQGARWTLEEKTAAVALYEKSKAEYMTMAKAEGTLLPSKSTIKRLIRSFQKAAGPNELNFRGHNNTWQDNVW